MNGYQSSVDYSWLNAITSMMATVMAVGFVVRIMQRMLVPEELSTRKAPELLPATIPWEAKQPLMERYGSWAVSLAEARCPRNDVDCVEREARILYETAQYRRARRA